ncbi:hypothetical protein ABTQ33_12820 (plasmid) [Paucilactobacillus suebicus]|jgi:hypothetical protein|uniref:hypothetical protein n=1 Tax=Paucilactobacillus suebicus TaxID=152335 RepID=UPI0002DF5C31|nr:hypothetical protein [Paucilactobacillus suebicus]
MKHGHKRSAIKKKKRRMVQHAKEHAKTTLDVQSLRPYKIGGYGNARRETTY